MKVLIGGLLCLGVVLVLGSAVLFRPKTVDLEPFNLTYSELKEMGITKRREVESNHSRGYVISIVDINSGKSSPEEAYEIEFSKYKISRVILVGGVIIVDAEYAKSDSLSFVYLVPHKTFGEYKGLRLYLNGVEVGGT